MSKIRLTAIALMVGLFLTVTSGAALADSKYPVATPAPSAVAPDSAEQPKAVSPAKEASDDNGILPNTGGPAFVILVAGIAFVVVGAAVVVASRRRAAH
ncbi:MAG: LPXTG cell wall anchor domain-containing protein [Aeromicrobium sp.]